MRGGTYSDPSTLPMPTLVPTLSFNRSCVGEPIRPYSQAPPRPLQGQVSIAHALGNLFGQVTRFETVENGFVFQSLMRWGTYSDIQIYGTL